MHTKKRALALAAAATLAGTSAWAQSPPPPPPPIQGPGPGPGSVTLYGAIDMAMVYVDNVRGGSFKRVDGAGNWASRWGMRGREDLGGGLAAVFVIEQGFNPDDGTLGQGGRGFGRQSFVGFSHTNYGTLTFGRQYDFAYAIPPEVVMIIGGLAGATGGGALPADMHLGGFRYDNTIKYFGRFGPVQAGLMYGLGSENNQDKMASAMLAYRNASINAGVAYVRDNFSPAAPFVSGNEVLVGTAHYYLTKEVTLIGALGTSKAKLTSDSRSKNTLVDLGATWQVTGPLNLGLAYSQSDFNNAAGAKGKIKLFGAGAYYDFSRRTTVYGILTQVQSDGAAGNAYSSIPGIGGSPAALSSSNHHQAVLKAGIRHFF